jgi:hypothetical protein
MSTHAPDFEAKLPNIEPCARSCVYLWLAVMAIPLNSSIAQAGTPRNIILQWTMTKMPSDYSSRLELTKTPVPIA